MKEKAERRIPIFSIDLKPSEILPIGCNVSYTEINDEKSK